MAGGIFFIAFFGMFFMRNPWGLFWLFPLILIGVLPLIRHIIYSRRTRDFREQREAEREEQDERLLEKQVLKAAKRNNGRVTPALVALDSSLSIEEAEKLLESFVKRGYATLEVTESGQLEYRFAEFLPPGKEDNP